MAVKKIQPLKNAKHNHKRVLDLLWAIRLYDRFYFDTYGKMWLDEMIKEDRKKRKTP